MPNKVAGANRRWCCQFRCRGSRRESAEAQLSTLGHAMILVLETNGSLLYLFSSAAEVESHFEAVDVENGEYEFCDNVGQRFVGKIVSAVTRFRAGSFRLKPDGTPDRAIVASFLSRARSLERGCDGVKGLDDMRRHLA